MYAERGEKLDVALQLAEKAQPKLRGSPEATDTLGWIYYKMKMPTRAVSILEESAQKDLTNPVFQYHLGMAYWEAGDWTNARRSLKGALKLKSDFPGSEEAKRTLSLIKK